MTTQSPDISFPQTGKDDSVISEVAPAKTETAAEVAADEPQNVLTKQFTEEEWKALKTFRTKLPEIWKAVYSADEAAAEPQHFKLWGVIIYPNNPASDTRASVILMKFLRARELNVEDAQTMLTATLRWREEFKVDGILEETFPEIFSGVGRIFGKDNGGRPVVYNIYGDHDTKTIFGDVQQFIRWRVQLMERCIQPLDFETIDQTVQVHDYEGVSMLGGRDVNQKAAASQATTLFQNYYPEMLHKKFFINVPTILTWIFWMFKPVISAKTYSKMSVIGTGKSAIAEALLPLIKAKELPKRYGGEAEAF